MIEQFQFFKRKTFAKIDRHDFYRFFDISASIVIVTVTMIKCIPHRPGTEFNLETHTLIVTYFFLGVSVLCAQNVQKAYPLHIGSGRLGITCTI